MTKEIRVKDTAGHKIHVEFIPPKHWWNRAAWKLLKQYPNYNSTIIAPKGFITDGATICWCMRWLFSPTGRYFGAAIIHDWILVSSSDWDKANMAFADQMKHLDVPKWRRDLMIGAVIFWSKVRRVFPKK